MASPVENTAPPASPGGGPHVVAGVLGGARDGVQEDDEGRGGRQLAHGVVYGDRALREYGRRSVFQGLLNDYINTVESDESLVKAIIPESQPFFSRRPLTKVY